METIDQYRQKTLNQQAANGGKHGYVEWGMKMFYVPGKKLSGIPDTSDDWEDATEDCTSYNPSMPR